MASTVQLKRSTVASKVPLTTDLALGELAINTFDGKVFIKKDNGAESIVEIGTTNLTSSANGSTVSVFSDSGSDVTIAAANSTVAGVLTAEAQTIGGVKTFASDVALQTITSGVWNGTAIAIANGGTGGTTANQALTNLTGYQTIATSGSTTALTVASPSTTVFTGFSAQTIQLPDVTTLQLGQTFVLYNNTNQSLVLQTFGGGATYNSNISSLTTFRATCISLSGTTFSSWFVTIEGATQRTGIGSLVLATNPYLGGLLLNPTTAFAAGTNAQGQGQIATNVDTVVIATTASNPSGATLPSSVAGRRIVVINRGTNPVTLYPPSGSQIDSLALNAALTIPVNGTVTFSCVTTTLWYSDINQLVNATGIVGAVAIANGGTGATDATTARSNLGLGTMATQNANNVAITGGTISTSTGNLTVAGLTNTTTIPMNPFSSTVSQLPFSGVIWHDLLRFLKYYTTTSEVSDNLTTWTSNTVDKRFFSGNEAQSIEVIADSSARQGVRWIFNNATISYSYGEWLVIGLGYSPNARTFQVLVESSADGVTWTQRHLSTNTVNAMPIFCKVSDNGGDSWLRVSIIRTAGVGAINLSSIRLLSSRWGDQGRGKEAEYPYSWDENGTITTLGGLVVPNDARLRNGTTATNFYVHNTYTDVSNYERAKIGWNANVLEIGSEALGTGTVRNINLIGGNVGIGTASPSAKLHLSSNGGRLKITQDTAGGVFNGIDFYSYAGGSNGGLIWNQNSGEIRLNASVSYFPTIYSNGVEALRISTAGNVGIGATSPSAKLDVVGDIEINSNVNLNSEATTLATTTKTQISSFAVASFRSGKLIVQAYDSVTGEVQISELLVAHNGTTASATEYGVVYTGAASLVLYDVDISAGNVRLMATRTSANSTQYKISKTVIVA